MKPLFALVVASAILTASAAYAGDAAVEATIKRMIDGFNSGDIAAVKATHVAAPSILDEVAPPYAWSGPDAFDGWMEVMGKTEAALGRTGGVVTSGVPTRETVVGDHAYVITPSSYTFKQGGRTMREDGTFTFVLARQGADWKIQSWAWTSPEAKAMK